MKKTTRTEGQAISNGLTLERCNTLVVDVVNKDPNYHLWQAGMVS